MKFKKIILLILVGVITLTGLTGCFGPKKIEKAKILTTTYALQYLVENLVSNPNNVSTIYPAGVNTNEYTLTDKQINTFAKKNAIFVYNGLTKERKIALNLINTNKNLVVVDCTKGMNIINDDEEIFISPSNYLMLAQNMKNDFLEQTTSRVTKEDIEKKYEKLKLTISTYDASLKEIASLATNKTLVVGDDAFLFLEKYGFDVLSVEEKENGTKNDMQAAKEAVKNKKVSNIFVLSSNKDSDNIKKIEDLGASKVVVTSMTNLSEADKNANVTYETIMNNFIESIRTEVYN